MYVSPPVCARNQLPSKKQVAKLIPVCTHPKKQVGKNLHSVEEMPYMISREREKEKERERNRERGNERKRGRDREGERETERRRERDRERESRLFL